MRELTVDEAAELRGCSVGDIFHMVRKSRLAYSSAGRFLESDVRAVRLKRCTGRRPQELCESQIVKGLPRDDTGRVGIHAFPDRQPDRNVNTLSDREVRTPRERIADELKLSAV